MSNQLSWCNANRKRIYNYAKALYIGVVEKRLPDNILRRCCDFKILETACIEYTNTNLEQKHDI